MSIIVEDRFKAAEAGLAEMRAKFGDYTVALERRLLMLSRCARAGGHWKPCARKP